MKALLALALVLLPSLAAAQVIRNDSAANILQGENMAAAGLSVDQYGRLFVNATGAERSQTVRACSSAATGTSDTLILAAGGAGVRTYITDISCVNTTANASEITFKDGSTAVWRGHVGASSLIPYWNQSFTTPLRGTANTAVNFAMTITATSTICCISGFQSTN